MTSSYFPAEAYTANGNVRSSCQQVKVKVKVKVLCAPLSSLPLLLLLVHLLCLSTPLR